MSNSINQVNYDALTQIAKQLHSESEDHARLNSQTRQRMNALQGGWQGDAAKAFFNEMNGTLLPAGQRLVVALQAGESALNQIMQIIRQADEETASYFKGLVDAGSNRTMKKNLIILNYGIDYQTDEELNNLKAQLVAQYGKDADVVILKNHPFDTMLQKFSPILSPMIATTFGLFAPLVNYLAPDLAPGLASGFLTVANKAVGLGQTISEYTFGWGTESEKVYRGITDELRTNPLIRADDVNVILGGQSGSGVTDANVAKALQNDGIHVSLINMGSPFSNLDQLNPGTTVIDIRHQDDNFGNSLTLGTLRSNEMRYGVLLAAPLLPLFITSPATGFFALKGLYDMDSYFRNSNLNVQDITIVGGNKLDSGTAHNSYFDSKLVDNVVIDAYGKAMVQ